MARTWLAASQVGPRVGFSTTLFFFLKRFENSATVLYMGDTARIEISVESVQRLRMRALLQAAGLSQAEFARRLECSVNTVNAWCAGRSVGSLAYRLAVRELERAVPEARSEAG